MPDNPWPKIVTPDDFKAAVVASMRGNASARSALDDYADEQDLRFDLLEMMGDIP